MPALFIASLRSGPGGHRAGLFKRRQCKRLQIVVGRQFLVLLRHRPSATSVRADCLFDFRHCNRSAFPGPKIVNQRCIFATQLVDYAGIRADRSAGKKKSPPAKRRAVVMVGVKGFRALYEKRLFNASAITTLPSSPIMRRGGSVSCPSQRAAPTRSASSSRIMSTNP